MEVTIWAAGPLDRELSLRRSGCEERKLSCLSGIRSRYHIRRARVLRYSGGRGDPKMPTTFRDGKLHPKTRNERLAKKREARPTILPLPHPAMFVLVLCLLAVGHVANAAADLDSDAWNDLTNNFATDIAPLIALFGEQVTKQFLSESTGILDNIIFGMAPLGILTAVVSAIRVYGWPSMKSFIGRAQEPHGLPEAELCSSTSYDVCELWSEGGICRVFGRPRVLEFFYKPGRTDSRFYPKFSSAMTEKQVEEPGPCDLYRPVCFFGACKNQKPSPHPDGYSCGEKDTGWVELRAKPPPSINISEDSSSLQFAPCPNMSLNIGIRVPPRWGLIGIVMVVSLIQLSFFGYAAAITFAKSNLYAEEEEEPPVWAFVSAVLGTAMLVSGMILCAFLIERRSTERHYDDTAHPSTNGAWRRMATAAVRRWWPKTGSGRQQAPKNPSSGSEGDTVIYWLQPGGQLVGDQQFNAFSYNKVKHSYTTSFKADQSQHRRGLPHGMNFVLLLALFASVVGFLLQFIGLRSLHGSVTLYQIAATLFVAMIRALLRQRRLKPEDNNLRKLGARFEGHELDWQAMSIFAAHLSQSVTSGGKEPAVKTVLRWRISDERYEPPGKFVFAHNTCVRRIASSEPPCLYGFFNKVGDPAVLEKSWAESLSSATEAVDFARRFEMTVEGGPPNWVATVALLRSRLAFITGDGMAGVQPGWDGPVRVVALELQLAIQDLADYVLSGKVPLRAVDSPNGKGGWPDVSAITWHTTVNMECEGAEGRSGKTVHQIISLPMFLFEGEWKISKHTLEAIIGLWACSLEQKDGDGLNDKVLIFQDELRRRQMLLTLNLWVPAGNLKRWEARTHGNKRKWTEAWRVEEQRIFLRDQDAEDTDEYNWHLIAMRAKSSRIRLLAQNIWAIFVSRLASIIRRIEISDEDLLAAWGLRDADAPDPIRATAGPAEEFRGLANTHVNFITKLFVQSGLGTEEEALMCILPVFDQAGILPREDDIVERILRWTRKLRRKGDFDMADKALKVALGNSSRQELIHGVGELYRKAYMAGRQEWAFRGFAGMSRFGGVGGGDMGSAGGASSASEPAASGWPMYRRFMPEEVEVFKRYLDLEKVLRMQDEGNSWEDLESLLSTHPEPKDRVKVLGQAAKTDLVGLDEEKLKRILDLAIEHRCVELAEDILEVHVGIRERLLEGESEQSGEVAKMAKQIHDDLFSHK
ncbi:hypothetical protein B0T25DRAFT_554648 [Lasiosphaeria hispida]|uniref:Uncharacterized protein n=1 Tax=Lasiosphaeria hispida TaxID=260671 RepID=A0AAJ0M968_9PEZI|nr:hypothetical protein B0T25DRAFT_554648 [Lasiosphaeria hispida]